MYTPKSISKIFRSIGLTLYRDGYNDPYTLRSLRLARWWEVYEDFSSQSCHPYPAYGTNCPAWSPIYRARDDEGKERNFADLMVFDLNGCSADQAHRLLVLNNLAGLAHPTRRDTLAWPRSRIIFLLHRPVNGQTYRRLWSLLAQEVLSPFTNPEHADFRQRYDQPHAVRGQSALQRHDGNLLHVEGLLLAEGLLGKPHLAEDALGRICQAYAYDIWPELMTPRNR